MSISHSGRHMPSHQLAAPPPSPRTSPLRWLPRPILAGASFRDRFIACIGAFLGIAGAAALSAPFAPSAATFAALVAPMGASAVLLFTVPASPLSQPWPVIGGNIVSALVGIAIAQLVPNLMLAAGLAVAVAIASMSVLRCLHPPGGGTALLGVLGGEAVQAAGFGYALWPVGLNALLLVAAAWLFHRFSGHSYPHRPGAAVHQTLPPLPTSRFRAEDIDSALDELGETFDVAREDLEVLFNLAETHARQRLTGR